MIFCRIFAIFGKSHQNPDPDKGKFLSEGTFVFVISPNRRTFYFPELENLNFGDFYGCPSQPNAAFLPLQDSSFQT